MSYRPRGALARTVYEKMHNDDRLRQMNKNKWYDVNRDEFQNPVVCDTNPTFDANISTKLSHDTWSKFEQLSLDGETQHFLNSCFEISENICWQIWLSFAATFLRWFMPQTSVNGFLGRGSMHVYSSAQFQKLIDIEGACLNSLLDIGAGDGETTRYMGKYFDKVYVTEMSQPMKTALAGKGFIVLDELTWFETNLEFSVITCLNVLDRCSQPISMLNQIKSRLEKGGVAVISFVIPYAPYVEFGSTTNKQKEVLPITGLTFESEILNFVINVLEPNGWELVKWTRVPYLCQGDIKQAFYWLDDAVFVIRPKSD